MSNSTLLPLAGKRILVTRTREQASVLSERLRALGAIAVEFPTIRIVPPVDWHALDAALQRLFSHEGSAYDWLVFTSANGVKICCERMRTLGYDHQHVQSRQHVRIATIGPATAAALNFYGITADLVPQEYIAESVATALIATIQESGLAMTGQRILLARAAEARNVLLCELRQAGAVVEEVTAYRTLSVAHDDSDGREIVRLLLAGQLAILTFTSSSTVRHFVAWLAKYEQVVRAEIDGAMQRTQIACIGPITAQTARECGLHVDIEATEYTIDGLVNAIIQNEEKVS